MVKPLEVLEIHVDLGAKKHQLTTTNELYIDQIRSWLPRPTHRIKSVCLIACLLFTLVMVTSSFT